MRGLKINLLDLVFEATIDGIITMGCRGNNGLGFDEIFELFDGRTLAEISIDEKNKLSPRKMALEQLRTYLYKK